MNMIWLWLSAITMTLTALVHSILGEKRLIKPLLALDNEIMRRPLARKVIRFAWHFTTILMILSALIVVWPSSPSSLIAITGALWLAIGLFDAAYTRGQHIGWPFLAAGGALALIGAMT